MPQRARTRLARMLLFSLLAAGLSGGCTYFPDPPPGWEGKYSADVALERSIEAAGGEGEEPLGAGADLISKATVIRHGGEAPVRLTYRVLWKGNEMWSIEMEDQAGDTVRVVRNGARLVELRNGEVARADVPVEEAGIDRYLHYLFPCHFFLSGAGSRPEIEETVERSDGGYSIRIGKYRPSGHKIVMSMDAESLRPLAVREWERLDVGEYLPLDTYFEGFAIDRRGNAFPRVMRTYANGELVQEMTIDDIAWNQGLRDVDFAVPVPGATSG